ncbi:hypothetical protein L596_004896 [Steinernema carpocapsae]|uniref:NADH dehydrogenase [ubiquinone] 1 beta subcomplex subunit 11, mitochondrial n=1 Tax=Steinernema carpocapsae TaxID=34508 RepID=A0A4U8UYA6_STECR|nr:hypothetical protein L596_004896 [Steinernema carpocapsae]
MSCSDASPPQAYPVPGKPSDPLVAACCQRTRAQGADVQRSPAIRGLQTRNRFLRFWPKLNKGRLDWLFGDGWRRPLAKDQGAKMRREWIWFNQVSYDEHKDWAKFHQVAFVLFTMMTVWLTCWMMFAKPDWPQGKEWALREAHLEMARREKAGLPYISKDLVDPRKVASTLPTDEELRDFEILI